MFLWLLDWPKSWHWDSFEASWLLLETFRNVSSLISPLSTESALTAGKNLSFICYMQSFTKLHPFCLWNFFCTNPFSHSHCSSLRPDSHPLCMPKLPQEPLGRLFLASVVFVFHPFCTAKTDASFSSSVCILGCLSSKSLGYAKYLALPRQLLWFPLPIIYFQSGGCIS